MAKTEAALELSPTEQLLVKGMLARLREIERITLDPYNADLESVNSIIEQAHGLPAGAINGPEPTHRLNFDTIGLERIEAP